MQQRGDRKRLVKSIMQFLLDDIEIAYNFNMLSKVEFDCYTKKIQDFSSNLFLNYSDNSSFSNFTINEWEGINLFLDDFYKLAAIKEQTKEDIRFMLNEVIL